MEAAMRKKIWEKPKLIVLVRAMPEEGSLGICKSGGGASGPTSGIRRCAYGVLVGVSTYCYGCDGNSNS